MKAVQPLWANSGPRFAGSVAVVTGAAGGIGAAIARRLAIEGATVVLCDALEETLGAVASELSSEGLTVASRIFDVSDAEACSRVIQSVIDEYSCVDVLVNNAGVNRRGDLLSLTEDDWRATFSVNVDAMFHLCRSVLPFMIKAGQGAIVNTASQWGLHPAPAHIAYNVSKAAVVAFTQNLARDYAPHNIRVNAVCPGEIGTPMLESGLRRKGMTLDDLGARIPLGRVGRPEEVAALVSFLASQEAPFICGSAVEITGAQAVS